MQNAHRKGRYGVDAPYVPLLMTAGSMICVVLAMLGHSPLLWANALILLAMAGVYIHATLRGKFRVWRTLLDGLGLHGDERVLDIGCGRGAVLLMVAGYLRKGRAVGVDIWSQKDQSGNAMAVAQHNADLEGVADRVELHTADMRQLPFEKDSFDVIVSSVAIHNINDRNGRERAIEEAWRVLRPGGRMLIADISNSHEYEDKLAGLGGTVVRRSLGWQMWWGGPWVRTILIDARKQASDHK